MRYKVTIVLSILFMLFFTSCTMKSTKEKLKEQYPDNIVKDMVHSTFEKYIDLDIKNISIERLYSDEKYHITATGNAISKEYPDGEFTFEISYDKKQTGNNMPGYTLSNGYVECIGIGQIVNITDNEILYINNIDKDSLRSKITENNRIKNEVKEEAKNAVKLAYQNKTKVHFGMSENDYRNSDRDFKKNFIDGLIGNGAINLCRPLFAKKKFVGFDIIGTVNNPIKSYSHVVKMAKQTHYRKLDDNVAIRFDSEETNYVCDLYNLQIFTQTDGASHETWSTITVYWNKYLKLYK